MNLTKLGNFFLKYLQKKKKVMCESFFFLPSVLKKMFFWLSFNV